jgi:hypothetical protein
MTKEEMRLEEDRNKKAHWRRWGPYLSERQWGTVREDYSPYGTAWDYFSHEQSRSRAYRWGEDGIGGISDNHQRLCFALALWNGKDTILKERIFGLTGSEGNHGEDVKDYYYYLDNTPTHSYMKYLYKYPQEAFPYSKLVEENMGRGKHDLEYELINTGVFDDDRYFDVFIEYAKASDDDILIRITAVNRGRESAVLHFLPTLWFRNTWSWKGGDKPALRYAESEDKLKVIEASHPTLGNRWLYCDNPGGLLFTDNETNFERIYGSPNNTPFVKDGINDYIVGGRESAVNGKCTGTKVSAHYTLTVPPGKSVTVKLRLSDTINLIDPFGKTYDTVFAMRKKEADEFYRRVCPYTLPEDLASIQRQAFAGGEVGGFLPGLLPGGIGEGRRGAYAGVGEVVERLRKGAQLRRGGIGRGHPVERPPAPAAQPVRQQGGFAHPAPPVEDEKLRPVAFPQAVQHG